MLTEHIGIKGRVYRAYHQNWFGLLYIISSDPVETEVENLRYGYTFISNPDNGVSQIRNSDGFNLTINECFDSILENDIYINDLERFETSEDEISFLEEEEFNINDYDYIKSNDFINSFSDIVLKYSSKAEKLERIKFTDDVLNEIISDCRYIKTSEDDEVDIIIVHRELYDVIEQEVKDLKVMYMGDEDFCFLSLSDGTALISPEGDSFDEVLRNEDGDYTSYAVSFFINNWR